MIIKSIKYGLVPFGPASGCRAFLIDIRAGEAKQGSHLMAELEHQIEMKGLYHQFTSAIDGTNSSQIYFLGGDIEQLENSREWDEFAKALSKRSLETQQALKRIDQMKPPFMGWVGVPTVFSSTREFYQNFNLCMAMYADKFSALAMQEILNHQFSSIIGIDLDTDTLKELSKSYRTLKIYSVNTKMDQAEYCLQSGIRFQKLLKGTNFLSFSQGKRD
jgi:hypothetical protein